MQAALLPIGSLHNLQGHRHAKGDLLKDAVEPTVSATKTWWQGKDTAARRLPSGAHAAESNCHAHPHPVTYKTLAISNT